MKAYKIVPSGSSHRMGAGLRDNETFKKLIDHRSISLLTDALFAIRGPESFRGLSPCSSEAAAAWLRIELDAIFCRRTRSPGMTYGYSLAKGFDINEERLRQGERISVTAGALSRLMADAYALMVRLTARCKGYVQRQLRPQLSAHLPWPLKVRIQRLLQKNVSHQKAAGHGFVLEEHKQPPSCHNSPQS